MTYFLESNPNPAFPQYGWPRNRVSGVVVVHTTENAPSDTGAVSVAGFMSRRTSYGSYHILADTKNILPLISPAFAAWQAIPNNAHALSVSGVARAADWGIYTPPVRNAITDNMGIAAAQLVTDAITKGLLTSPPPARRISPRQGIDGTAAGFVGHGEIQPTDRTDPGPGFDWTRFLTAYQNALTGTPVTTLDQQFFLDLDIPIP